MPKVRSIAATAALTAAALAGGLLLAGPGRAAPSPAGAPTPSVPETAAPLPAPAPSPAQVVVVEPVAQPQPEPKPQPGVLAVGPSQVALAKGDWTAEFAVANVGGSDMAWFAVGVPSSVGLSATKGWLAPGEETTVTATVDHTKLAKGGFSLTLHVSANDTADSVTITGIKEVKVAVPPGPGDIKAVK